MALGSSTAYESICVSFVIKNLEIKLKFTDFFSLKSSLRLCHLYSCSMYFSSLKFLTFTYLKDKFTLPRFICRGGDTVPWHSVFVNSVSLWWGQQKGAYSLNVPPPLSLKCLSGVLSQVFRFIVLWRMKYLWCFIMWGWRSHKMCTQK